MKEKIRKILDKCIKEKAAKKADIRANPIEDLYHVVYDPVTQSGSSLSVETDYLLSTYNNKKALMDSIAQDRGEGVDGL